MEYLSEEMEECIDACVNCERVCKETAMFCLFEGNEHSSPDHIGLLKSCAAVCRASAELMIAGSQFSRQQCLLCAQICYECSAECNSFTENFMKECAEVCEECAETCSEMATVTI